LRVHVGVVGIGVAASRTWDCDRSGKETVVDFLDVDWGGEGVWPADTRRILRGKAVKDMAASRTVYSSTLLSPKNVARSSMLRRCLRLHRMKPCCHWGTPLQRPCCNSRQRTDAARCAPGFSSRLRRYQRKSGGSFFGGAEGCACPWQLRLLLSSRVTASSWAEKAGVFDIDPGVEGAFGEWHRKPGMAISAQRRIARGACDIPRPCIDCRLWSRAGFDGGDLGKFSGAGEGVQDEQVHGVDYALRRYGVAQAPSGHGEDF